ncbi:hypothetical protein SAPIO_CDS5114 [Scedosporium apiospermum]|uniref:Uncharacterized protein n=1 Tax=Pseudallescheria apiosperma TaxID=563466 RepID=A0A084G6S5_PSEDA|nr:uncharacterized protein SAPIO_CDS5114 [Scedosporium apiospermum]KEZ43037.1 hypothetical protein SAPIO_CDS5114 [Scedosporium apiospermum]
MLEALAAVGLAGNVVQFISFASDLISASTEIHGSMSGCSEGVLALDAVYGQLGDLSAGLDATSNSGVHFSARELAKSVATIKNLSRSCKEDCDKLLGIVQKLKTNSGSKSMWKSFRVALKTVWEKKHITQLEERLSKTQVALTLQICAISSRSGPGSGSHWHSDHNRELQRLQLDAHVLHLNQSKKLNQISDALSRLETHIASVQSNPHDNPFIGTEIVKLEDQFRQLAVSEDDVAREKAVLETLRYESMPVRHSLIPEAHKQTFRWIFQQPSEDVTHESKFCTWLGKGNGIFWISGKPGSGKSTLMKFITDEDCTQTILSTWAEPKSVVIASHFFWSAGTAIQKSQEGLLRSLLYDIFRQCPDLIEQSCPEEWLANINRQTQVNTSHSSFWTPSELHKTLRRVAKEGILSSNICFFVDGLDEYDGDHFELCRILQDLAESPNIKICLSSRPWPVFEEAFGSDPLYKIHVHELTRGDIQRYSNSRLQEHPRWSHLASDPAQARWLLEEITERASGVFLWVFLVTKLLREGLTNRDSFSDLVRRLEAFPLELDAFFRHILESVDPFYHCKMSTTLQITLAAVGLLHPPIFEFHDMEYDDPNYALCLPLRPLTEAELGQMIERISWRLKSRCRGLIEIHENSGAVTFLHRTVMDFLQTREMSDFLSAKGPPNFNADLCLVKAFTAAFKLGVRRLTPESYKEITTSDGALERTEFPDNLLTCLMTYAARIDEQKNGHEDSTYKILDDVEQSIKKMKSMEVYQCFYGLPSRTKFRHCLVGCHLVGYLRRKFLNERNYAARFGQDLIKLVLPESPRFYTFKQWKGRWADVLRCLLETGLNIDDNKAGRFGSSPWAILIGHITSWAAAECVFECYEWKARFWTMLESSNISLALKNGADPNALVRRRKMGSFVYSTAWIDFLLLSFDISANPAHESLFLKVLADFINAGADLKTAVFSLSEEEVKHAKGGSTVHEKFFGLLERGPVAESSQYNLPLLAEVTNVLLSKAHKVGLEWPMADIWRVVDKVFPPQLRAQIRLRYTRLSQGAKDGRGAKGKKRKRDRDGNGRTVRRKP